MKLLLRYGGQVAAPYRDCGRRIYGGAVGGEVPTAKACGVLAADGGEVMTVKS